MRLVLYTITIIVYTRKKTSYPILLSFLPRNAAGPLLQMGDCPLLHLHDNQPQDRLFDGTGKRKCLNLDRNQVLDRRLDHHTELARLAQAHGYVERIAQVFMGRLMNPLPKRTADQLRCRNAKETGHAFVRFENHEGERIQNH